VSPKASIIIRCCNEEKHIGRLLSGIFSQNRNDIEILLVDSGSDDATLAIASHYPVKIVRIKPEDFSFGYSLNQGCKKSSGEFLVFASAHVYPLYRDWIDRLLQPFKNEKVALTYGKQRGNSDTKYSEQQIFYKWFPESSNIKQNSPFCNNANTAIRRCVWEKEKYNEDLTGLEDLDWAKRIMESGYDISYVAEAEVIHVHDEPMIGIFNRYRREAIALRNIYPDEYLTVWDVIKLTSANIFNDYVHASRERVLLKNMINIPVFRFLQFIGGYWGGRKSELVSGQLKEAFYYPRGVHHRTSSVNMEKNQIDYSTINNQDD
jgi:glycosyltransferase involved in cell wall biosynthesis